MNFVIGAHCRNERMQPLGTSFAVQEALLDLAGGGSAARIDVPAFLQPDLAWEGMHAGTHKFQAQRGKTWRSLSQRVKGRNTHRGQ